MSFSASDVDAMTADSGQLVTITRPSNGSVIRPVAFVRAAAPADMVAGGGIYQQKYTLIISGTEISNASGDSPPWPGSMPDGFVDDPRIPRKGDTVLIDGRPRLITASHPVYIGTDIVRVNIEAMG